MIGSFSFRFIDLLPKLKSFRWLDFDIHKIIFICLIYYFSNNQTGKSVIFKGKESFAFELYLIKWFCKKHLKSLFCVFY